MMNDPFDLDGLDDSDHEPANTGAPAGPPPWLNGLNPMQKEAVEATDGPLLVLAGAGTGKTRVLTTRLGHIIMTNKASPWNVLAVTFTNKAAIQMKNRVAQVLRRPADGMWIGTFHSICVKILRKHAELVGLESNFTILDTDDQIRLLKQLIRLENIDDKLWPAKQLAALIDRWKNRALTPARIPSGEGFAFANGKGGDLYAAYQKRLLEINACDFGDLLMHCITLLQQRPDILKMYHDQFRYIMVDEYQDTNVAQYLWLRLLAQGHNNICCVGDDDQSIYGWRGAEVGNILRFSEDFKGAKVIRLEQNYRSTGHILAAAGGLIGANEERLGKTLWTEAGDGEKISVKGVWDGREEARSITDEIESLQAKGESLNQVAILVRAGFQMRELEDRIVSTGLAYRVVGGPRFYERAEVRDAMAYLRVIAQPSDDLAFERIINVPKRGIGDKALQTVRHLARTHGISLFSASQQIVHLDELSGPARRGLSRLMDDFDAWRKALFDTPHTELVERVMEDSGYLDMWRNAKSKDVKAESKIENIRGLYAAVTEYENLGGFLEHVSLVMENEQKTDEAKLSLMTLHAAKGLEFNYVFLAGWEEEIFPSQRALDDKGVKALEEERRLAYVGLTRAKLKATIYHAGSRNMFGQWRSSIPSRFIEEIPADHVEVEAEQGLYGSGRGAQQYGWHSDNEDFVDSFDQSFDQSTQSAGGSKGNYGPGWKRAQTFKAGETRDDRIRRQRKRGAVSASYKKVNQGAVSQIAIGQEVFHEKFGTGLVIDAEGNKLLVNFEHAGEKRVMDSFVRPL